MYKKILVAVDLGEEAVQVMKAAKKQADLHKAELKVYHVFDIPMQIYGDWITEQILSLEDLRVEVSARLKTLATEAGLGDASLNVVTGHAVNTLMDVTETENPDLIVMGSHGKHGLQLLLGSTATGVLHHAKCDVLAVRVKQKTAS